MNAIVFKVGALLLLASVALADQESSFRRDACRTGEREVVLKMVKGLSQFLKAQDLSFEDVVDRIFSNCDSNEDSYIDWVELEACIVSSDVGEQFQDAAASLSEGCKAVALQLGDVNGDGVIGELELKLLLKELGL